MKKIHLLFLALLVATSLHAQHGLPKTAGAYGAGMGNASVTYNNIYSAFGNQAGLADLKKFAAVAFVEQRYLLPELRTIGIAAALPTKTGTFGLAINHTGDAVYNEQKIGLSYARKLSNIISVGAQFDYLGTRIAEYGSHANYTFELGMQATLMPKFRIGAHVFSPIRQKINETDYILTLLSVGVAYEPSNKFMLTAAAEQNFRYPTTIKAGMQYRMNDAFSLRAGFGTGDVRTSFGVGLNIKPVQIDIAAQYHRLLGFSPTVSFVYAM